MIIDLAIYTDNKYIANIVQPKGQTVSCSFVLCPEICTFYDSREGNFCIISFPDDTLVHSN